MSESVRSTATAEHPSEASGLRTALATVCISGTLEDKLDAAAAAGFDGIEIFEPDLVVSALSPTEIRARCAELGLSIDLYQPFRDLDSTDPERLRPQPAPRRAQVRAHGRAGHGPHPGLLRGGTGRRRRPRPPRRPAARRRRASRSARDAHRLRGARLGHATSPPTSSPGRSCDGPITPRSACAWTASTSCPAARDPAGIARHPRREAVLPPARRRPAHGHGRAAVEPSPPPLPRPGRVRPARLPRPRARRRLHRAAVARGVQRRLPPVRPAPGRRRRPRSLLALREATAPHARCRLRAPAAAPRSCTGSPSPRSPSTPPPGAAVAALLEALGFVHTGQHRSKPVQLWEQGEARVLLNASGSDGRRRVVALGIETADPTAAAGRATALLAPPLPQHRGPGRGGPARRSPRRTAPRSSSAAAPPRASAGWPTSCRPGRAAPPGPSPTSTTSRSPSPTTTSTRPRCSTARCSDCRRSTRPRSPPRSAWSATAPSATAV